MRITGRGGAVVLALVVAMLAGVIPTGVASATEDVETTEPAELAASDAGAAVPGLPPLSSPGLSVPLGTPYPLTTRIVSPDGATVYSLTQSEDVVIFDTRSRTVTGRLIVPHIPRTMALSPDGKNLYVGTDEGLWVSEPSGRAAGAIVQIDTASRRIVRTVPMRNAEFKKLSVSADGTILNMVYRGGKDGDWAYYDAVGTLDLRPGGALTERPLWNLYDSWGAAYSPDFRTVYEVVPDGDVSRLIEWDIASGEPRRFLLLGEQATALRLAADGRTAVVGGWSRGLPGTRLEVIDIPSMTSRGLADAPADQQSIAISADGATAVATSDVGSAITVVDTVSLEVHSVVMPQYSRPAGPSFVSDGRLVVAVDEAGRNVGDTLYVIDPATGAVQARVPGVGALPEASPDGRTVYSTLGTALGIIDLATIGWHPAVDRIAGADRYSTSVAVSTTMFPQGAPVAYVVSGEGFADALSASTAAAERGGPLLLTPRGSIPSQVLSELKRLQPKRIVVVGGPASVAPAAVSALKALGVPVVVLSGADRYATARAVIHDTWPEGAEHVFVASGASFPDALSAASAAHSVDAPLLIVPGAAAHLDATTTSLLTDMGASRFTIVGGPVGVTAGIAADLATSGGVERLAGADRFATSAAVNEAAFPSPDHVYLASGVQFPDALSGGVLAALGGAPLFVVPPSCVPTRVADRLAAVPTSAVTLVGGTSALTDRAALLSIC